MSGTTTSLWPFIVYFLAVLALVATMLGLSYLLGQRRANRATNMPFESGILSVGSPQIPLRMRLLQTGPPAGVINHDVEKNSAALEMRGIG